MFDILFGWRKASKCKKLIRQVQCRLKLLKNKRSSIVRQLRDDVAQLLKNGHDQKAFNRVEQLFKDESIVMVYDLLDHFCEFILIHLSYIRRNKDCPNDINEAVSSLIFASARCGDLPELPMIRKLFGERYGQRFALVALELLPGNLVNRQIRENLSMKSVSDDVKYRLVDEIARSCLQTGPLALEYISEMQQQLPNKSNSEHVPNGDVQTGYNRYDESQSHDPKIAEADGKIVHVDFSSEGKKFLIEPCHSYQDSGDNGTSTKFSTSPQSSPNKVDPMKQGKVETYIQLNYPYESTIFAQSTNGAQTTKLRCEERGLAAKSSSSESSSPIPEEMIYLDDIEEFQSPMTKDANCQDQRLFVFTSSVIPTSDKFEGDYNEGYIEQYQSWNEKAGARSSRKSGKAAGKRLRKRLFSWENSSVKDVECKIYYTESCENFPNQNCKSHHWRKHHQVFKMEDSQKSYCAQERLDRPCCAKIGSKIMSGKCTYEQMKSYCSCSVSFKGEIVNNCSLERPCYVGVSDEKHDSETPPWQPKRRIATLEWIPTRFLKERRFQHGIYSCPCSCNRGPSNEEAGFLFIPQTTCNNLSNKQTKKFEGEPESCNYARSPATSMLCSRGASPRTRKETQAPYLRAMTMPPERPKDNHTDNILRSNSFPFQQPSHLSNGSSSSPYVHPKLPDYDELAAKFTALKQANLQNKQQ